ncbi:hypothetical protein AMTRI_Chr04g182390 [Amborella trichopoda]|uniref:Glycosyltransferase n=1 Tax=Amborella trichopoda TaxID=13333 RepID=U5CNJ5_AMBTC|nr:7-deoxyloganetin glucosyltransferase [Amborella trichopoda]ERN14726.1 hypothetical protein AMTR_s00038p00231120 [Amborella trichopoda]|eukprot:XP_006853259.1 7-deoxyloganetin glucosyltransferase [Amborella trichopoda]
MASTVSTKPHAVCVPFPAQSHINAMVQLAKLLHTRGFHITFVNTEYNHQRLLKSRGSDPSMGVDGFVFDCIPDGLPPVEIEATQSVPDLCYYTRFSCVAPFRELLARLTDSDVPPVSCVISDTAMNFTQQVAIGFGIRRIAFYPASASSFLAFLQYPELQERGYIPLKDESQLNNGYLETPLDWIDGMLGIRLRDMPSLIRTTDPNDIMLQFCTVESQLATTASAMIINTFDHLEATILKILCSRVPSIYTIGPLHTLSRKISDPKLHSIESNLWIEDTSCLEWLDNKQPQSVLYVNFGSITVVTSKQLEEFAWGLANSKMPFLWVIRPDLVREEGARLPQGFAEETKERGIVATWCNQEQVLGHRAIGGFLTHSGWNSTMESICNGVPMICWPFFADQQTNCYLACAVWGIGIEIDNNVKREEVEAHVKELLQGDKGKEMRKMAMKWKELAENAIEGGSSINNLDRLVTQGQLKLS